MSIKAISLVWERSKQSGSDLLLMLAIADYAKDDGKGAWPSLSTLAKKTRMGRRNVIRRLAHLEEVGEIAIHTGAGLHGVNVYDICLPASDSQDTRVVTPRPPELVTPESPNPSSYPSFIRHDGREKTAPKKPVKEFTPQAEIEMLLGSNRHTYQDAEREIKNADWKIQPDEVRWAVACFLAASALPVPQDKPTRKDWYTTCKQHLETFGLVALQKFYPIAVKQLRNDGMTVARPGALTKTLADLNARASPLPTSPPVPLSRVAMPADVRAEEEARLGAH